MHSHFDFKDGPFTGCSNCLANVGKTKSGNVAGTNIPRGGSMSVQTNPCRLSTRRREQATRRIDIRGYAVVGRTTWLLRQQIMLPAMPPLPSIGVARSCHGIRQRRRHLAIRPVQHWAGDAGRCYPDRIFTATDIAANAVHSGKWHCSMSQYTVFSYH